MDHDNTSPTSATEAARAEGFNDGFAAATAQISTVIASEFYAGREALAASLFSSGKMTAEQIICALSVTPKGNGSFNIPAENNRH